MGLQVCAAFAIWVHFGRVPLAQVPLALAYVFTLWMVAWAITLGVFVAISLARFRTLVGTSLRASASVMWLIPGLMLVASYSPLEVAVGLAVVALGTGLLATSRPPKGASIPQKPVFDAVDEPLLFAPPEPDLLSRDTLLTVTAALLVQVCIYALASRYPLLAGATVAAITAIWSTMSVAHGVMEPKTWSKTPYAALGVLTTLLFTVTLTAVLVQVEVVQEMPLVKGDATDAPEPPSRTGRLFERLTQVPPPIALPQVATAQPSEPGGSGKQVAQVVDPTPAAEEHVLGGIPGVILRPKGTRTQKPQLTVAGLRYSFAGTQPLSIPFTGEYEMFRTTSGKLPAGASIEAGTPLERVYGTTNGGSMETVAVQTFDPPLDLSHCRKIMVALTSAEQMPLLASMQFVGAEGVEEGGTDLLGMKPAREQTLEFQVPPTNRPMLIRSIRISFMRPLLDRNKNVRIAVERFTLVPAGIGSDFK